MRLVVDGDASWKFNSHRGPTTRPLRLFDRWQEIKALVLKCSAQRLRYKFKIALVGNGLRSRVAYTKNPKRGVVAARKNVGAQNVQRHNRK